MEEQNIQERSNSNLSMNLNRDNRRKYNHFKGVIPSSDDLNQIFGNK